MIIFDFVHPNGADLRLIMAEHLRQCGASLRVLLQHVESVRFAGLTRLAGRMAGHVHFGRQQTARRASPVQQTVGGRIIIAVDLTDAGGR